MLRILLVDDDSDFRGTLAAFLERRGLGITAEAGDGLEALGRLSALPADLVITDCQMPTMNGIEFVRALRMGGFTMPVIMISGQGDPKVVQMALGAGVSHYVEKPMRPEHLEQLLKRVGNSARAA